MSGTLIPILLAIGGCITAFMAYKGIQRGGARFFQLERDGMLRRASFTQLASLVLFVASIGLLLYQQNQLRAELEQDQEALAENSAENIAIADATLAAPEVIIDSQPPTIVIEPDPTDDPDQPTPTPTPELRRAEISNTGASGAYLRGSASTSGEELQILDEGSLVTLVDEDVVDADGYKWVKVRTLGGDEGWVAEIYLTPFER